MALSGGKILIIDDLSDWRDMISGLLQDAGYDVQTAAGTDEAMHHLRQQPYHVAIVDIRLDEADENNKDGLILAARMKAYLPELAILILTGFADIPSVKYALQPREDGSSIAFDFLEKSEIPSLLQRIEMAFAKAARVNPQLEINFDSTISLSLLQKNIDCLRSLSSEIAALEITDLLQRVFYEAEHIEVKAMNGGHSSGSVVLVTPTMRGIPQTDVVVKFNQREKAELESQNYDKYVQNYVGGARRTQRLDFRATARLGGIGYSFVGADAIEFQQFSQVYTTKDINDIEFILDNLFNETCYTWYTKTLKSDGIPKSLSAGYKGWLRLDTAKLITTLTDIVKQTSLSKLSFVTPHRLNQSEILLEECGIKLTNPLLPSQAAFAYNGSYCFTHGDLHEGNILVDSHNQTWLIDFYHTGPAHPVRDFAMIESAIKFSLQMSDCPLNILYDWERSLIHVESLNGKPIMDSSLNLDSELVKAAEVIWHVRSLLAQILPEMTLKDYLIALYFHALKGMTLAQKFNERQRLHALVSAALMTEVLQ